MGRGRERGKKRKKDGNSEKQLRTEIDLEVGNDNVTQMYLAWSFGLLTHLSEYLLNFVRLPYYSAERSVI